MKVVADAGPLMALGKLGLVYLLHELFEQVLIPTAVYEEVVTRGLDLGQPDAYAVQLAITRQEIVVMNVRDDDLLASVRVLPLARGERHAIHLALRESADWILLDDQLAREEAQRLELKIKGTLGVISEAYRRGLTTHQETEFIFQAILTNDDIWISEALVRRVWEQLQKHR